MEYLTRLFVLAFDNTNNGIIILPLKSKYNQLECIN